MSSVRILSVAQCHESLLDSAEALIAEQWPLFMLSSPVSDQYWDTLYREENLPFQQVAVVTIAGEEQVIGLLSAIPFYFPEDAPLTDLPDEGWDAVLTQGATDTRKPTFVSALSVTVDPDFRGRGIPAQLITALKAAVAQAGLKGVVVPVRPALKAQY
ncbi:GNAT family N-acetyltransferase [Morganella morganii]